MRALFFRSEPCEAFALRAQITAFSRVHRKKLPHGGVSRRLFSLEGIHGSSSRIAKSIGPSALPVPDDDHGMKRSEIRQRRPPYPQKAV